MAYRDLLKENNNLLGNYTFSIISLFQGRWSSRESTLIDLISKIEISQFKFNISTWNFIAQNITTILLIDWNSNLYSITTLKFTQLTHTLLQFQPGVTPISHSDYARYHYFIHPFTNRFMRWMQERPSVFCSIFHSTRVFFLEDCIIRKKLFKKCEKYF